MNSNDVAVKDLKEHDAVNKGSWVGRRDQRRKRSSMAGLNEVVGPKRFQKSTALSMKAAWRYRRNPRRKRIPTAVRKEMVWL